MVVLGKVGSCGSQDHFFALDLHVDDFLVNDVPINLWWHFQRFVT